MSKVTGPLFGTTATGAIAGLGYFRQGRHGPQFIPLADTQGRKAQPQRRIKDGFKIAHAEWCALPKTKVRRNGIHVWRILPIWTTYWATWLANHPEYRD